MHVTSSGRARAHIRDNVVGYVALFLVIAGGTASALPGRNTVNSGDIKAGQVKASDIGAGAVNSATVADNSLTGTDIADDSLTGADIDEGSLALPATPTALPPNGPAGGDLQGSYPDPEVKESGLAAGGDLTGSLDAAQVGPNTIGDAEITNSKSEISISPAEMAGEPLVGVTTPDYGLTGSGSWPAILYDPNNNESLVFSTRVPDDLPTSGASVTAQVFFSAPATGGISWNLAFSEVSPGTSDVLSSSASTLTTTRTVATANTVSSFSFGPGSPSIAAGDLIRWSLTRNGGDAADTVTTDAAVLQINFAFSSTR